MISISWISSCFVQSALSHSIMEFHRWEPWCQSNSHSFIIVGNLFFFYSLERFKYIFLVFWNFTKLYLFVGYFSLFIARYQVNILNLKICPLAGKFSSVICLFAPPLLSYWFLCLFYWLAIGPAWLSFLIFSDCFFPLLSGRYPQIYFIDHLMTLSTITFLISRKLLFSDLCSVTVAYICFIDAKTYQMSMGYLLEYFKLSFVPWIIITSIHLGASQVLSGKESACQCRRRMFNPGMGRIPWRRKWQPTPVFLPGESHRQRSLAGYSPWSCKESDTTEHTLTLFILILLFYVTNFSKMLVSLYCPFLFMKKPGWVKVEYGHRLVCGWFLTGLSRDGRTDIKPSILWAGPVSW